GEKWGENRAVPAPGTGMALRHTRQRSRQASSGSGNGSFGTTGVGTMPAIGKGESLHFRQAIRERVAAAKEPQGSVFGTRCCARLRYLRDKFEPIPAIGKGESRHVRQAIREGVAAGRGAPRDGRRPPQE